MKNKRFLCIIMGVIALMIIPLVGMLLSPEVNWSIFDFLVMGMLLMGTGFMLEIVLRRVKTVKNRIAFIAVIVVVFLLIWVELAVGVFGTPLSGI